MRWLDIGGLLAAVGCSFVGDEAEIRRMLDAQIQHLNNRDIDGYMSTIASEASGRPATEQTLRQLAGYNLQYQLEDVKILNVQNGRGVARVVQTTRVNGERPKLGLFGMEVEDVRTTTEHTVVKESRGWRVTSSRVINTEPLTPRSH